MTKNEHKVYNKQKYINGIVEKVKRKEYEFNHYNNSSLSGYLEKIKNRGESYATRVC